MSRYDWSKARPETKYMTTDADGMVKEHFKLPRKVESYWHSDSNLSFNHTCPDWEDSLEERPKWEPKFREPIWVIDVRDKNGYCQSEFITAVHKHAYNRGYVFRTEEEAIAKVKELGWIE